MTSWCSPSRRMSRAWPPSAWAVRGTPSPFRRSASPSPAISSATTAAIEGYMEKLTNYDTFAIEQFSYFLSRLEETKDVNGKPLLGSTMSLFGSGMSYGHSHGNANLPAGARRWFGPRPEARQPSRLQPGALRAATNSTSPVSTTGSAVARQTRTPT